MILVLKLHDIHGHIQIIELLRLHPVLSNHIRLLNFGNVVLHWFPIVRFLQVEFLYYWAHMELQYRVGDLNKIVYTNPIFGGMQSFNDTFKNRIISLINEIKNNNSPDDIDGSGLDGLKAQIVLEAAVQSIKKEKVIKIKDVFTI